MRPSSKKQPLQAIPNATDTTSERKSAQRLRIHPKCRVTSLPRHSLAEIGMVYAGIDQLYGYFYAGTACSPTHLLWFAYEGMVQIEDGHSMYTLEPGHFIIAPAGSPHWLGLKSRSAQGLWFHLEDRAEWEPLKRRGMQLRLSNEIPTMMLLMKELLLERGSPRSYASSMIRGYEGLICTIIRRQLNLAYTPSQESTSLEMESLRAELIHNPEAPWTIDMMARKIHVSGSHFYKLALQYWKSRPMQVVTKIRMDVARDLLMHTTFTLEQIAEKTGYQNPYAFSHMFLRSTGMRPGAFRKAHLSRPNTENNR